MGMILDIEKRSNQIYWLTLFIDERPTPYEIQNEHELLIATEKWPTYYSEGPMMYTQSHK